MDTKLSREKARVRWQALFAEKHGEIVRQQKERKLKAERLAQIRRIAEERV